MGWCRGWRCKEVRIEIVYKNALKNDVCAILDILASNSLSLSFSLSISLILSLFPFLLLSFLFSLFLVHSLYIYMYLTLSLFVSLSFALSLSFLFSISISLWFHLCRFVSCTHIYFPDWRAIIRRGRQLCWEHTRKNIFPKFLSCWYVHCFAVTPCVVLEIMIMIWTEKIFGVCIVHNILHCVSFFRNNSM